MKQRNIVDRIAIRALAVGIAAALVTAVVGHPRPSCAGDLFDNIAQTLSRDYYDREFRRDTLPGLIERFQDRADAATTIAEEKQIVDSFLAEIPASHLALLSERGYETMLDHIMSRPAPMAGFELMEIEGEHFVHSLLEGGPGERAGLRMGDRVISIDGEDAEASGRLDWSSDDAALPDPPMHSIRVEDGETLRLAIQRTADAPAQEIEVVAAIYTAFDAARASARLLENPDFAIGYVHLHYIHMDGVDDMLVEILNGTLSEIDALVLDLRGRGGNAMMVPRIVNIIAALRERRGTPVIAIIDACTRSAKEAIAYDLQQRELALLVGETTAGALLPASFKPVGEGAVLMYPAFELGRYSERIEGIGVAPHIEVSPKRRYTNGKDPLLQRALQAAAHEARKVL